MIHLISKGFLESHVLCSSSVDPSPVIINVYNSQQTKPHEISLLNQTKSCTKNIIQMKFFFGKIVCFVQRHWLDTVLELFNKKPYKVYATIYFINNPNT